MEKNPLHRQRSTKVVATLGPASSSDEMVERLFLEGVDVFRLNFSHGSHDGHLANITRIRAIEAKYGVPIGIMMDLQGPKLRLGGFVYDRIGLPTGAKFRLDLDPAPGGEQRVCLPHPEIFAAMSKGTELLVDDGKVRLRVDDCGPDFAEVTALVGGTLSNRKGVNVPNAVLPISALTEKDRKDLAFGLDHGVDWVAMSFVQRPEDVMEGRGLIGGRAALLAKLEKPSALEHLNDIIRLSDGLMVARGDLGVEIPPEDVPMAQRRIIHACRKAGKPVIVATQMLESMIKAPTPTRAEASDVATAVLEGADAVMLSAESAAGDFPLEAVAMMNRIIHRVQEDPLFEARRDAETLALQDSGADAITSAAKQVAKTIGASAIVTYTSSGSTTLRASRERPNVPIFCLTANVSVARRLALAWAVHSAVTEHAKSFSEMVEKACALAYKNGFAGHGDRIVITAGVPFGTAGVTNILRFAVVEAPGQAARTTLS